MCNARGTVVGFVLHCTIMSFSGTYLTAYFIWLANDLYIENYKKKKSNKILDYSVPNTDY